MGKIMSTLTLIGCYRAIPRGMLCLALEIAVPM
jgi:hypothetical protein